MTDTPRPHVPKVAISESSKIYQTRDLQMASALFAAGHKLVNVSEDSVRPKAPSIFSFENVGIKATLIKYANGELMVDAKQLFDSFRNLKNWVHNKGAR